VLSKLLTLRPPGRLRVLGGLCVFAAVSLFAADRSFTPYPSVKPLVLPPELRDLNEAKWLAWARRHDRAVRARLEQGDLDSLVNLLLYGTSFTSQPRVHIESLTEASKSGVLRARVDDLVAGLHSPGNNVRLQSLQRLVPDSPAEAGKFVYTQLLRVLQERQTLAARAAAEPPPERPGDPASLLDRASFFRDRGVSLDTGIIPEFTVEQTLRDLKQRGVLREGQAARVAVIGPGLDFIDKNEESAYDYYPPQTLQPFALADSLLRLKLAGGSDLAISILDISPRVLEHVQRARARAAKNIGYVIQLPRDVARPWPPGLVAYWNALGDRVGTTIAPIRPPEIFRGLETRAVQIRPAVVLAAQPVDLDIIVERLHLEAAARFDLLVGTNIFVYYDAFEQSLALENVAAMLKPGGLLLTNDRLPETPVSSMHLAGVTVVPFDSPGISARLAVGWYQKR
jgi:hypothetical protein